MYQQKSFTDMELLSALRSDKEIDDGIRYVYDRYFEMAKAYIMNNSGQVEDVEDIFQEVAVTFIDVVRKDKFRGEIKVRTFIYSMVRNAWLNEMKKRGSSKLRDEKFEKSKDPADIDAASMIANRESTGLLMKTIEKLGEACKRILVAFYFEKMEMKEILQLLHYENEQVVRNKKYKCMKQLEELITSQPALAKNLQSILFYE
jgi:RNA polymerase sigma factor (sigma-70 family)